MNNQALENLRSELYDLECKFSGIFAEYQISEDDRILVDFEGCDQGIKFTFDFNELNTYFSDDVIKTGGDGIHIDGFILPFDPEYLEDLQYYLEQASKEISEGFLLPNDLYYEEGDQ
jgi:hypothetical protein